MDQSESNNQNNKVKSEAIELPRRKFTVEFMVGVFTIIGLAAIGYQAIGLGGLQIGSGNQYEIFAEFDNISGLQKGAPVEIAGVSVGEVSDISLKDPEALLTFRIDNNVKIKDDDIASIRTKGIIGDRYVKISRGASEIYIEEGETMVETESVVDIEDIIGKIVHSISGDDEE